jgi:hypothetical protein|tara:strand:- start:886 stop:1206 length:321 start_codon:yes stop_codon:yes gene_type:complete
MSEVENSEGEVVEAPSAVNELINQITSGDLNNAEGSFKSIVQDKMADALEAQRIATAQAIFNDADDDVEIDETDIETEEEVEETDETEEESEEIIAELDDDEVETA